MNKRDLRWVGIDKTRLPRLLLGRDTDIAESIWSVEQAIHPFGIAVGFHEEEILNRNGCTPSVIVFADEVMVEALSWLKAFASETSPLSQFARVLSYSDWRFFSEGRRESYLTHGGLGSQPSRWACVILGELLSQSDGAAKLSAIPLSHTLSCFSMTLARAELLHGSREVAEMCLKRLQSLQEEGGLTRRTLSSDDLIPLWAMLSGPTIENPNAMDVVEHVLGRASGFLDIGGRHNHSMASYVGVESGLFSDSVEQRVKAYNMLLMRLNAEYREPREILPNLLAAAGAFLVGRSASHFFLLQRAKEKWPAAMAWFAVFAAEGGPELWDSEWARAVKGVERVLRSGLDDTGVSAADLSWAEYAWLRQVFDGPEVFADIPKMQSRTLSVEVVPGALCQFRLAGDSGAHTIDRDRDLVNQMSARIRELEGVVGSFIALASRSRQVLDERAPQERALPSPHEQATLHFEEDSNRAKPVRRGARRSP